MRRTSCAAAPPSIGIIGGTAAAPSSEPRPSSDDDAKVSSNEMDACDAYVPEPDVSDAYER
jgi:hypothetical protein